MEKEFPFDFELKKEILVCPEGPLPRSADILEIGPGRGDFLLSAAASQRRKIFITIEVKKRRFFHIAARLKKGSIENVTILQGDARVVIPTFFSENTFEKIYCLFPDPWPKDRHAFHRLLNEKFLWLIAFTLRPGGSFIFATDDLPYASWVSEEASRVTWWRREEGSEEKIRGLFPETFYENKWRALGRKIILLEFRKT